MARSSDTRPRTKRVLKFAGRRITVYRDTVLIKGKTRIRDWVKKPLVSAMVVVKDEEEIILVRQYRHGANARLWEIPAGTVDEGESPRRCALREVEEETGFQPGKLISLGYFITAPAETNARVHLYLATRLKKTQVNFDSDEIITLKAFQIARVRQMLKRGEIRDAKSIIGLYRYFNLKRRVV
jgi:ADP-ribose pyrophosphatase